MNAQDLADRLNEELRTTAYADIDGSPNGLQVGPGDAVVETAAAAVDASAATIDAAITADADMLLTHHGLWWEGTDRVTGITYDRLKRLLDAELPLYVAHLPLDGHQEYGNAAGLADVLDLRARAPFGAFGAEYIGQQGHLPESLRCSELVDRLATELPHGGQRVQVLDHGPAVVDHVAIVTGSGVDYLQEAVDAGADVLVTGEGKQVAYHESRELGINLVLAGHYATEVFGVTSLLELLGTWGIDEEFLQHPTGL